MLLLHADWVRDSEYGLVGAMDDEDAKKARELAPHLIYKRIDAGHVIHSEQPELFVDEIDSFISQI